MQNSNYNICSQAYLVQRRVHAEKYGLKSLKQFTQKIFNILFTNVKKKTLWPLFIDGAQLTQGYGYFRKKIIHDVQNIFVASKSFFF